MFGDTQNSQRFPRINAYDQWKANYLQGGMKRQKSEIPEEEKINIFDQIPDPVQGIIESFLTPADRRQSAGVLNIDPPNSSNSLVQLPDEIQENISSFLTPEDKREMKHSNYNIKVNNPYPNIKIGDIINLSVLQPTFSSLQSDIPDLVAKYKIINIYRPKNNRQVFIQLQLISYSPTARINDDIIKNPIIIIHSDAKENLVGENEFFKQSSLFSPKYFFNPDRSGSGKKQKMSIEEESKNPLRNNSIPDEIVEQVLPFLDNSDLNQVRRVNRRLNNFTLPYKINRSETLDKVAHMIPSINNLRVGDIFILQSQGIGRTKIIAKYQLMYMNLTHTRFRFKLMEGIPELGLPKIYDTDLDIESGGIEIPFQMESINGDFVPIDLVNNQDHIKQNKDDFYISLVDDDELSQVNNLLEHLEDKSDSEED